MSDQYSNELEIWFSGLPSLVQEVLHEPFTWMDDALKKVAGNPQELLAAGARYSAIGVTVRQIADDHDADVASLSGQWSGEAYQSFAGRNRSFDDQTRKLADAIARIEEVLKSGATACVEGANMICEIVVDLIEMALATIAVNVALSVISFGTTLAAAVVEVVAEAAVAVARVARVVEKLAQIILKLAELLGKLARLLRQITEIIKSVQAELKAAKALSKGAKGWDWVGAKATYSVENWLVSKAIWAASGGQVSLPGLVGSGYDAVKDGNSGYDKASDAADEAVRKAAG